MRSGARSHRWQQRDGGCVTRCPTGGVAIIDRVAIAPTGIAFAIETKTRTFDAHHVCGVREMAAWLYRRRRRWCPRGALPVLCVVRARGFERVENGVLMVSLDRLVRALRATAGVTAPRVPGSVSASPASLSWRGTCSARVGTLKLSDARAASVVAWLVSKGITADRLTAQGYGMRQPIADNGSDEGRAKNRRVELKKQGCSK